MTVDDNIIICNFTATYSGSPLHTISGRIIDIGQDTEVSCNVYLVDGKNRYQHYLYLANTYTFRGLKDGPS